MKPYKSSIKVTFVEPLLAMMSGNKEIQDEFISSKAPSEADKAEELASLPEPLAETLEKSRTVFPRESGALFLWDYQIKGTLKAGIGILAEMGEVPGVSKWTYKRIVNTLLHVYPRKIMLRNDAGLCMAPESILQRPLRAETMQGPRICLAGSELLPAGTWFTCDIEVLESENPKSAKLKLDRDTLTAALNYGKYCGIGQWRNAGYGRYTWVNQVEEMRG